MTIRSENDPEGPPIRYFDAGPGFSRIEVAREVTVVELQSWAIGQTTADHVAVSVEHGGLSQTQVRYALNPYMDVTEVAADE